ncbi:C-type mannose receptor 2-like [Rhinichthys klamathensis goyatoka]|uniref:C-type mannose receptor 2-like n=1 Tax=Rhinichthys klamathensis goyatoka TaxID=3034132 RepID=UPI0024B5C595|nr:C-type mannose receptor 2-like [Rhinichthys klamathensis goyatoka]
MERITLTSLLLTAVVSLSAGALRQYHFVNERKNWTEAQTHCREKYTDLATITDTQHQTDAERVIKSVNPDPGRVWIGLKKTWIWSLNDPTFYTANESQYRNWAPASQQSQPPYKAQPEGDGDCVFMMKADGQWHDEACSSTRPFICYNASSKTWVPVNVAKTWTEAQSYCRQNHTDLVSVRNQSENNETKKIIEQNLTTSDKAWIGLKRLWVWSDNSSFTFTHWLTGEPNINKNRDDVCTAINIKGHQGRWTDDECKEMYPFVCYDDKLVLIRQNLTWTGALKYCRDEDMDLVSVDSPEIQLRVENVSSMASTAHVWLGLRHSCVLGLWFWVNGQTLCYEHWDPGHGTGEENCITTVRSGAIQTSNQLWISLPETETHNFICTK